MESNHFPSLYAAFTNQATLLLFVEVGTSRTQTIKYSTPISAWIGLNIRGLQTTQCLLLCYLRQVTAVIETGIEPVRTL